MTTARDAGEFGLIERIARIMPGSPDVIEGIGDDCAVIQLGDRVLLASTDLYVEDVHFRWAYMTGEDVGWNAATAGLSDIAAMGGRPMCLLVSLACPGETDTDALEAIARGIGDAANAVGAAVVGGDTTRHPTGVLIDVVALGEAPDGQYVTRAGARPGDVLVCTGAIGGSAAGLHALENELDAPSLIQRHKRPEARVAAGLWLVQHGARAMIDISDGLVQDAGHIANRSGVAIDIVSSDVPMPDGLAEYCAATALDAKTVALTSGEEYELLFSIGADLVESLLAQNDGIARELTIIGSCTDGEPAVTVDGQSFGERGYDHFA